MPPRSPISGPLLTKPVGWSPRIRASGRISVTPGRAEHRPESPGKLISYADMLLSAATGKRPKAGEAWIRSGSTAVAEDRGGQRRLKNLEIKAMQLPLKFRAGHVPYWDMPKSVAQLTGVLVTAIVTFGTDLDAIWSVPLGVLPARWRCSSSRSREARYSFRKVPAHVASRPPRRSPAWLSTTLTQFQKSQARHSAGRQAASAQLPSPRAKRPAGRE